MLPTTPAWWSRTSASAVGPPSRLVICLFDDRAISAKIFSWTCCSPLAAICRRSTGLRNQQVQNAREIPTVPTLNVKPEPDTAFLVFGNVAIRGADARATPPASARDKPSKSGQYEQCRVRQAVHSDPPRRPRATVESALIHVDAIHQHRRLNGWTHAKTSFISVETSPTHRSAGAIFLR